MNRVPSFINVPNIASNRPVEVEETPLALDRWSSGGNNRSASRTAAARALSSSRTNDQVRSFVQIPKTGHHAGEAETFSFPRAQHQWRSEGDNWATASTAPLTLPISHKRRDQVPSFIYIPNSSIPCQSIPSLERWSSEASLRSLATTGTQTTGKPESPKAPPRLPRRRRSVALAA